VQPETPRQLAKPDIPPRLDIGPVRRGESPVPKSQQQEPFTAPGQNPVVTDTMYRIVTTPRATTFRHCWRPAQAVRASAALSLLHRARNRQKRGLACKIVWWRRGKSVIPLKERPLSNFLDQNPVGATAEQWVLLPAKSLSGSIWLASTTIAIDGLAKGNLPGGRLADSVSLR